MKNVVLKSSVVILFILLFSCHSRISDSKKNELKIVQKKGVIITDSENPNFIYDLIKTQKVTIGDTVLFREWKGLVKKPVTIYGDEIKFTVFNDTASKFYKTGKVRFSKDNITVLNNLSKRAFKIYSIAILNLDSKDAYDMNEASSYLEIKKKSKIVGTFDFGSPMYGEYFMDFKIKDNAVHILKLSNIKYSAGVEYEYKLDTLIILKNNSHIFPDSLRSILCKEKNRIPPVKDTKTVIEYLTRGSEKEELEDYHGAIVEYNKALGLEPQNALVFHNIGLAKYSLQDYEGAIADFGKSIEIEPNASSYFNRGLAKYELQNYKGAIADYDKSISLAPHSTTYLNRANSKIKLGQKNKACLDYKKSVEMGIYSANDSIKKYCN